MPNPHDTALLALTAGCAVGALLMADAADEALHDVPAARRRRAALLVRSRPFPAWVRPVAFHCLSLSFLSGMAVSGAILVGVFP